MPGTNRILWGEGLFLRPQHFQQQALFLERALADVLRQIHANPWGVKRCTIDSDALRGGTLRLGSGQAAMSIRVRVPTAIS